ncbi:MAG TPA: NAD(P)-dependent alcohol dehydrogenase [Spirochaetia bacterium]|nr:NAD(P)-dependent alcohol dehydrogenase [Spirochaetia bacterium]
MKALVLEKKGELSMREIAVEETLGPDDVRIAIRNVGICGSDIHYYTHGGIGPFIVREPMILGHEASGEITEVGANVKDLKKGDRVCMEPGIPNRRSRAYRLGMYNLDPDVVFWATPPVHGVTRPTVVHPADFTFKLPDNVSYAEGALVEPLAIGLHAAKKAEIEPGDVAAVIGAGTIGLMTAASALAAGCSRVIICDMKQPKLDIAARLGAVTTVNIEKEDVAKVVERMTDGWGVDVVFEASGSRAAAPLLFTLVRPGGRIVYVGMPVEPVQFDIVAAQAKEATVRTIFRYANVYPRAVKLISSGKLDLKALVTETYGFADGIKAYEYAINPKPTSVKVQIEL